MEIRLYADSLSSLSLVSVEADRTSIIITHSVANHWRPKAGRRGFFDVLCETALHMPTTYPKELMRKELPGPFWPGYLSIFLSKGQISIIA